MWKLDDALNSLCGENNWVAYCINLERCPERRNTFSQWASNVGLTFKWWKATDKLSLTQTDYDNADVYVNGTCKQAGATACRLSHHYLYEHLLREYPNHQYFFVLEDDAGFVFDNQRIKTDNESYTLSAIDENKYMAKKQMMADFFEEIIKKKYRWDMLWFGVQQGVMCRLIPVSKNISIYAQTHLTHAMLLSRKMVDFHLSQVLKQPTFKQLAVDWTWDLLRTNKIGVTLGPNKSLIEQVDETSYIWKE